MEKTVVNSRKTEQKPYAKSKPLHMESKTRPTRSAFWSSIFIAVLLMQTIWGIYNFISNNLITMSTQAQATATICLKHTHTNLLIYQSHFWVCTQELKAESKRCLHTNVTSAAFFTVVRKRKQFKCPLQTGKWIKKI